MLAARATLVRGQQDCSDVHTTEKVSQDELVQTAEGLTRSLQRLDVNGQTSVNPVNMQPLVPKIVNSLVEYHANIGCYQCYLFLDSHKDGYKQTDVCNTEHLCVRVEFPYVKLTYSNDEERLKVVWQTEIERNVDVAHCIVEDKEDHWYLRLPIRPSNKQSLGGFSSFTQVSFVELRPQSYASVCCRGCNSQLLGGVENVEIEKVLPLPSANWMDMFDFWGAGIGAFEHIPRDDIHAQLHRVLVGESYILLHTSNLVAKAVAVDCGDEMAVATGDDACGWVPLVCVACSEHVGLRSVEQPETVRLHKHCIGAHELLEVAAEDSHVEKDQEGENIFGNYTIDSILSAKLLEMADSDGIFRFVLTSPGDKLSCERQGSTGNASVTELQLHLLSWETMIKPLDTNKFRRVLKVLYSPRQAMAAIPGLLPSHEVSLPPVMCLALAERLQASTTLLPSSLRTFNRMNVGYLFA